MNATQQKEYRDERIANGGRSVGVLAELAKQGLTMHDGTHLPRIARLFCTTIDNVLKCAERHDELLRFVKDQQNQIADLTAQIGGLKARNAQRVGDAPHLQPWEMTTEQLRQHLKETWIDPFADDSVGFGTPAPDSPLCTLEQ